MERLTKNINGVICYVGEHKQNDEDVPAEMTTGAVRDVLTSLFAYEEAEEQGRLIVLPCKVGDTVYAITRKVISEFLIEHLEIYDSGIFVSWRCVKGFYGGFRIDGFPAKEIGETVFLTREAAEEALQKTT